MKTNNLLLTLLLTLFTVTANAAITPTKTMTIDASQMNATDYPVNSLRTVLENLTLTGTWEEAQVKILSDALSGASITGNNNLLKTADLSNAVMNSMKSLFKGCRALTDVTLPTAINGAPVSFCYAFCNCEKLKSVSGINRFTCITDFSYAICGCLELTSITLPEGSTSTEAISFEWAFANTPKVIEILNFEKFTNIKQLRYAFFMHTNYVSSLTSVKMPESNSYIGGIDITSTFAGCDKLTGNLNLSAFIYISKALGTFYQCSSLQSIELGGMPSQSIANAYFNTFLDCSADCKVYLREGVTEVPEGWKDAPVKFVLYNERITPKATMTIDASQMNTIEFPVNSLQTVLENLTLTGTWEEPQVKILSDALSGASITGNNNLLKTADLSNAVMNSMKSLFKGCKALTDVTLPTAINETPVSFCYAFFNCEKLKSVSGINRFTCITDFSYAICECLELTSITLPEGSTSTEAISFEWAFANTPKIIEILNFEKFTNIKELRYAFFMHANYVSSLTSVKMPESNSYIGGIDMESAFNGCDKLTGNLNLSAFTNISKAFVTFRNCSSLESITLGGVPTILTYQGYENTFLNCSTDCKVYLPESVTEVPEGWKDAPVKFVLYNERPTPKVTYTEGGEEKTMDFSTDIPYAGLLANATAITATGEWTNNQILRLKSALKQGGNVETENTILTTADLNKMTIKEDIAAFYQLFNKCTNLKEAKMPISDKKVSIASIFSGCTSLTTADLSGLTNVNELYSLFDRCSKLANVKMPTLNIYTGALSFSYSFYKCAELTSINLNGFTNVDSYNNAFDGCIKLVNIQLPNNPDNATAVNFNNAFNNCTALTSADLSGFTNINDFTNTFYNCTKLKSVKLPVTSNSTTAISFMSTFYSCEVLTSVNLQAFTNVSSYSSTFSNCYQLVEVRLGTVAPTNTEYGYNGTFNGCTKDCKVYLPEGVTEVPEGWQDAEVTFMINGQPVVIGINTTGDGKAIPAVTYIYSIDGRLVRTVPAEEYSERLNGLDRGVYIVNGKKEAVVE